MSPASDIEVLDSVEPLDSIPMEVEFINNEKRDNDNGAGPHVNRKNSLQSTMRPNMRGMIRDAL
jgi:hypothetical protein